MGASEEIRGDAIVTLNTEYGKYLPNLLTEKSSLEDIETAQKAIVDVMLQKIALAVNEEEIAKGLASILKLKREEEASILEVADAQGRLKEAMVKQAEAAEALKKKNEKLSASHSTVASLQQDQMATAHNYADTQALSGTAVHALNQELINSEDRLNANRESQEKLKDEIVKLNDEAKNLAKTLITVSPDEIEPLGGLDIDPLEKYNLALASHKEKLLIARDAKILQIAVDMAMKEGVAEVTKEILKEAEAQVALEEATKLSAQQRAAIQTEYNQRYIEAVKGTYALEDAEITAAMERYGEVEKDKTKLTEMETALRAKLHIKTAQTVASSFADSMKTMADAGMVGQKTAKRFAQVQALVDAYASANAAYKAMAGIPVIGPALAIAAAAAAIGAGLANVKMIESAATGFEGVVDRPTMFMTGEGNKREHVAVTPLEAPNINGPQGGGITVNISGGIIQDDYIRNTLVPALNKADSMGA